MKIDLKNRSIKIDLKNLFQHTLKRHLINLNINPFPLKKFFSLGSFYCDVKSVSC